MTKIYTKTGDGGETSLLGGERVSKADLRIEAIGTLDELNAWIGLLRDFSTNEYHRSSLMEIQKNIFEMGAQLADSNIPMAGQADNTSNTLPAIEKMDLETKKLETAIDLMTQSLEPLKHFILPGGHPQVSYAHLARTTCRHAERIVVLFGQIMAIDSSLLKYLNRLSDYLFVLARTLSHELGVEEIKWMP